MPDGPKGKIFLNYRRGDDPGFTTALYQNLELEFGAGRLFMDVEGHIKPGDDFLEVIRTQVADCDVLLAVIGPRWAELLAVRAAGPHDFVAIEIKAALDQGKRVIPVLVGGALFPSADIMPKEIRALARKHAIGLRPDRFKADCHGLTTALKEAFIAAEAERLDKIEAERRAAEDARGRREVEKQAKGELEGRREKQAEAARKQREKAEARKRKLAEQRYTPVTFKVGVKDSQRQVTLKPGESFRDFDAAPELVVVPPGVFLMGSKYGEGRDNERPQHEVLIPQAFAVGKYPVTFSEWDAAVAAGGVSYRPDYQGWNRVKRPVINVSWDDAKEYIEWLSKGTGQPYRLLSEAEWEYACRAGTVTAYAFGDSITQEQAQFSAGQTAEVGPFPANNFGLHGMHGNVWEWCEDAWHQDYMHKPEDLRATGGAWTSGDNELRVLRGGSWISGSQELRSGYRDHIFPIGRNVDIGFRVARTLNVKS